MKWILMTLQSQQQVCCLAALGVNCDKSAWTPQQAWSPRFCPAWARLGLHEWHHALLTAGDMASLSYAQLQGQQIAALAQAAVAAGNVPLLTIVVQLSGFTEDMGADLQLPKLLPHLNVPLLEWLCEKGADLQKADNEGHTLLSEASTNSCRASGLV